MGEIIFSIFVGGWMIFLGVIIKYWSKKEEKRYKDETLIKDRKGTTNNT